MKRIPPLLITASLDPGETPLVALRDVRQRTLRHMEGLIAWLRDPYVERVVFAKNCRAKIREEVLLKVARDHGKELEFLQVESSPRTAIQGKGFGEGDLISQALSGSRLLKDADEFLKITGKLYVLGGADHLTGQGEGEFYLGRVEESQDVACSRRAISRLYPNTTATSVLGLLRRRMRIPWGLIAAVPSGWIDTRFYRVNRGFYLSRILQSHERVQDGLGYTLENSVYDDLLGTSVRLISEQPMILGTSGTLGTTASDYSADIKAEASDLLADFLS